MLQAEDGKSDDKGDDEEETALEKYYETLLDKNNCVIDEYQIFKSVLESELL